MTEDTAYTKASIPANQPYFDRAEDEYERRVLFEIDFGLASAIEDMRHHGQRLIDEANRMSDFGLTRGVESKLSLSFNMDFIGRLEKVKNQMADLAQYQAFRAGARNSLGNVGSVNHPVSVSIIVTEKEERLLNQWAKALLVDEQVHGKWDRPSGRSKLYGLDMPVDVAVMLRDALRGALSPSLKAAEYREVETLAAKLTANI